MHRRLRHSMLFGLNLSHPRGMMLVAGKSHHSGLERYTRSTAGAQRTAQSLAANSTCASVGETGLEPATPGPPDQYSNHLSYSPRRAQRL